MGLIASSLCIYDGHESNKVVRKLWYVHTALHNVTCQKNSFVILITFVISKYQTSGTTTNLNFALFWTGLCVDCSLGLS